MPKTYRRFITRNQDMIQVISSHLVGSCGPSTQLSLTHSMLFHGSYQGQCFTPNLQLFSCSKALLAPIEKSKNAYHQKSLSSTIHHCALFGFHHVGLRRSRNLTTAAIIEGTETAEVVRSKVKTQTLKSKFLGASVFSRQNKNEQIGCRLGIVDKIWVDHHLNLPKLSLQFY